MSAGDLVVVVVEEEEEAGEVEPGSQRVEGVLLQ